MYLEKEDVSLYYEVRGTGKPLVLIHGVIVDAGLFERAAELLAKHFQVITFDRRGNSRSRLREEKSFCMDAQADDIRDLLDALGVESADLAGCSAGAVIGQHFLQRYPERVRHLILFEPAMLGMMMGEPELKKWVEDMNQLVEKRKFCSAVLKFAEHIGSFDKRSPAKNPEASMREMGNHQYALTVEFPGLVDYVPDLEKLKRHAEKLTVAAGEKSGATVYARAAGELAEKLGKKVLYYPGYHNLPYDLPEEFAVSVLGTLMLKV